MKMATDKVWKMNFEDCLSFAFFQITLLWRNSDLNVIYRIPTLSCSGKLKHGMGENRLGLLRLFVHQEKNGKR